MFNSTEQALAVAYWMAEHRVGPKSSTAMAIDVLRERFDTQFVERLPSGLSPHEWQAQATMTIRFAQRLLADHPSNWPWFRPNTPTGATSCWPWRPCVTGSSRRPIRPSSVLPWHC